MALDRVKILVLGDSGVGKTCLVHLLRKQQVLSSPAWTIGCSIEIQPYEFTKRGPSKTYFFELWDVGGSFAHQSARSIFYNSYHGLILVHDLTNRKSYGNLSRWLAEVLSSSGESGTGGYGHARKQSKPVIDFDPEQYLENQVPILVVGTKQDLIGPVQEDKRFHGVAEGAGAEYMNVNCMDQKQFLSGSPNQIKVQDFFDKVIERKFYSKSQGVI
ncbi:rab-like protein 3 isoform X2 [Oscarella lobularis]|uniref:rab-like protein 3 isoform X2 n=1 Tax=Oscarella lobularis TaxID=121494 RepID=UPI003313D7FD